MKIAIIGTHGVGKTTLAYNIAAQGKKKKKNCLIVNEVARSCPFPLNDDFTLDGATWIITSQINRELEAKSQKVDYIICDRSAYDPICYLKALNKPTQVFEKLEWYVEEWLRTYDTLIFVIPSNHNPMDDGTRSLDLEFQRNVHTEFYLAFDKLEPFLKKKILQISASQIFDGNVSEIYREIF